MESEVKVSVLCAAYNHANYIRKTLDGFISQKTDFAFEVWVHDDASTDDTAQIIREYEQKWPQIIKPIYQTENQYQQKVSVFKEHLCPKARGKYIAICEGDDYWTDDTKLQQQFDYMEAHPDCSMVAHKTVKVFEDGSLLGNFSNRNFSDPSACYLSAEEVITNVNDFHTSSLFFRKSAYERNKAFFDTIPEYDYAVKILFATDLPGDMYIIPEVMSAYRVSAVGSWSQRIRDDNTNYIRYIEQSISFLKDLDEYREHKYHHAIETEILNREFKIEVLKHNKAAWKMEKYQAVIQAMPGKQRISSYLDLHMPKLFKGIYVLYQHIKRFVEK